MVISAGNDSFMSITDRLKIVGRQVKTEIRIYQAVIKDRRTPLLGKILLGMAVGYFFLPFDLIPDFIPVLGHVDDIIIIPTLVLLALKIIPKALIEEHRNKIKRKDD